MVSSSSFEETIRRQWQRNSISQQVIVPDGQVFTAYRDAVKRRLARYDFARPLQLRKNPHQQTEWTNWLEYINYEQWWLEGQTAIAESLEERNHQAWRKLLQALGSSQPRQRRPRGLNPAKGWKAAQAEFESTDKMIDDFIRETAKYRYAATDAYFQRLRVEWAVKEARLMEAQMSQQRKTAKNSTKFNDKDNRKRRRADDNEDQPPEPWSKRTRHGCGSKNVVSYSAPSRRSKRLAKDNTKA